MSMARPPWSLSVDILSARALVWFAAWGRDAELTPDAHRYFFDRYSRLAGHYRRNGRLDKARRFQDKAEQHRSAYSDDGPPYAAAMAMPHPRPLIRINAVSSTGRWDGPDAAA